jgi:transglutaminase-like putative cysteine protease
MQGSRVGYRHTAIRPFEERGQTLQEITTELLLRVARFGDATQTRLRVVSVETPSGELVRFESRTAMGPSESVVTGAVDGDQLVLNLGGQQQTLPWSSADRGFLAVEQSLAANPLGPGEHRSIRSLSPPPLLQVSTTDLVARKRESTKLLSGAEELLRIDASTVGAPGQPALKMTLWTDEQGLVRKTRFADLDMDSFTTIRQVALHEDGAAPFDLGSYSVVKLDQPLPAGHETPRAAYRVQLAGDDPAKIFPGGPSQKVRALGGDSAELTVRGVRPDTPADDFPVGSGPPTPADLEPNSLVQSDDPTVKELARRAAGGRQDPWTVAKLIEAFVQRSIKEKNFSQAFASAADVAKSLEGDCTEHAVLLAALARANNIPARVAIGLVYMPSDQGFGYHMWNELWIDGRWIPLDGTLGLGGIGAGHLKLTDSNLAGADGYSSFLPVAQVLGRLKIEVLPE